MFGLMQHTETPSSHRWETVCSEIACRAEAADRGEADLGQDLAALHGSGFLATLVRACGLDGDTALAVSLLRRIGRASLSVGRLVEGHVNALKLIELYGDTEQKRRAADDAEAGAIFGVWGAEGAEPVGLCQNRLTGTKIFCSGLGLLTRSVVTVRAPDDDAIRLALVSVGDPVREDASRWRTTGMRATASGSYDFDGVEAETLGRPGDYLREPHFEGGVWRYCALHTGGLEALVEVVRQDLLRRGRSDDPHQSHRLARLAIHAETARLWVERAARQVEAAQAAPEAVTLALLGREAVERECLAAMAIADRALGTSAFFAASPAERIRRDLAFFLRQANLDGKLAGAAAAIAASRSVVGEMW